MLLNLQKYLAPFFVFLLHLFLVMDLEIILHEL